MINNYIESGERIKKKQQEDKLMEWLASVNKTGNNSDSAEKSNKREKIFEIRRELIEYRKTKAKEKNIPPCYVFTNEELDKMLALKPRTYSDLSGAMILPDIKLKLHGKEIIEIFNK